MYFPWTDYIELPVKTRNTLQIFITNKCQLSCKGCFVRNIIKDKNSDIHIKEYKSCIEDAVKKGVQQINLLGGEPLLHPQIEDFININESYKLKTTIYTNGLEIKNIKNDNSSIGKAKIRLSIDSLTKNYLNIKPNYNIPSVRNKIEPNFMVSKKTKVDDLLSACDYFEKKFDSKVFFISSYRELDKGDFFEDTNLTMPLIGYKELVHEFLKKYEGNCEIHISKRGVFESTLCSNINKCRFANYFIGYKLIQCPYDIVNEKYYNDYTFGDRFCEQNNTCLMTKVIYKRK